MEKEGKRIGFCQNVAIEYLIHNPLLPFVAVHKCFDHSSISNATDFGCGKVTLQGRKHSVYSRRRISHFDQIDSV